MRDAWLPVEDCVAADVEVLEAGAGGEEGEDEGQLWGGFGSGA